MTAIEDDLELQKQLIELRIKDLTQVSGQKNSQVSISRQRYAFHGSSLHLVEEICQDAKLIDNVDLRRKCFGTALSLAPVSVPFFETFLSDADFLLSLGEEEQKSRKLFSIYYEAACVTMNPKLWCSLVELALLPQIDFNDEELKAFPLSDSLPSGPPLLFPAPDLFLGCAEFPTSLALMNIFNEKSSGLAGGQIEEPGDILADEFGVSPLTNLLASALTVCSNHPTLSYFLWAAIRANVNHTLTDLLDKWQTSDQSISNSAPLSSSHQNADAMNDLEINLEEPHGDLLWAIFCESWRLRLLFYRQLNIPAFNLLDVLDEYRLFEHQLPDVFRILSLPLNAALSNPDGFRTAASLEISFRVKRPEDDIDYLKDADKRLNACLECAERYFHRSERAWGRERDFERLASHFCDFVTIDVSDQGSDQNPIRRSSSDHDIPIDDDALFNNLHNDGSSKKILSEDVLGCGNHGFETIGALDTSPDDDAGRMKRARRHSGTWEGGSAGRKERICQLWTDQINEQEAELVRLQNTLANVPQRRSIVSRIQESKSALKNVADGHKASTPKVEEGDLVNFLQHLDAMFSDGRYRLAMQKRKVVLTYIRAIEDLGDVRLDLFGALWEFLQRVAADCNILSGSRWLQFWLTWTAETACRNQPLRSCCWIRHFEAPKRLASRELDDVIAFVNELSKEGRGPFWKFLRGPNWWKVDEILPPPGCEETDEFAFALASDEVIESHTAEFLTVIYEAIKACEDVFRVYLSQNKIFTAASNDPIEDHGKSETEMSNDLFYATSTLITMAENRVSEYATYVISAVNGNDPMSKLEELQPLIVAFFTALLSMKVLKGIFIARLRKPLEMLWSHCDEISSLANLYEPLILPIGGVSKEFHQQSLRSLITNVKIGLMLSMVACLGNRYFTNLKGTWIGSTVIRGDCSPHVVATAFFNQPFDSPFDPVLQRLLDDDKLSDLSKRPELQKVISKISIYASQLLQEAETDLQELQDPANKNSRSTDHTHGSSLKYQQNVQPAEIPPLEAITVPLSWLAELNSRIEKGGNWTPPTREIPPVTFLPLTTLSPTVAFPMMGAPVRVALEELKERPFSSQSVALVRERSLQTSLDYASHSSSSSSSDVSLTHTVAKILSHQEQNKGTSGTSASAGMEGVSINNSHHQQGLGSTIDSPHRSRYSSSYSPQDSFSTSPLPSHGPSLGATSPARKLSVEDLGKLTQATRDGHESTLPSLAPAVPPDLPHHEDFLPVSKSRRQSLLMQQDAEMDGKESKVEIGDSQHIIPRTGSHFLQQRGEHEDVDSSLFGTHIEWKTLWVSNLEMSVTGVALEHELNSLGCKGVKEVRIVTDRKQRSKGFGYIDFDSNENVEYAQSLLNGRKLQGLRIKAAISIPKNPIYEDKVLFVTNIPNDCNDEKLGQIFDSVEQRMKAQHADQTRRKRSLFNLSQEQKEGKQKKVKVDINNDISQTGIEHHDHLAPEFDANMPVTSPSEPSDAQQEGPIPWKIVNIRLRSPSIISKKNRVDDSDHEESDQEDQGHSRLTKYGYVEFSDRRMVLDVLKCFKAHEDLFVINGSKLLLAPSVPKREKKVIKAPKARTKELSKEGRKLQSELEKTIHISNLPFTFLEDDVRTFVSSYGDIEKIVLPRDPKRPSKSRGFAFVEFKDKMDASVALNLDGMTIEDRILNVAQSSRPITSRKREEVTDTNQPALDQRALNAMHHRKIKKAQFAGKQKLQLFEVPQVKDGNENHTDIDTTAQAEVFPTTNAEFKEKFLLN